MVLGRLFKRKEDKKLQTTVNANNTFTIESVNDYKYNAWNHEGVGEYYARNVDQLFFDNVTKKYFLQYINPDDKVLDVGAGTGRLSIAIAQQGNEVVAIDISRDMLKQIEENKNGLNISTIVANCETLPFDANSFDKVVSLDAMIHFIEWEKFLKEQIRVVKPDGLIIFNIFSGENLCRYSQDKIERGKFVGNGDFVASVTKQELSEFCSSLENIEYSIEIVAQIPFYFFYPNTLAYGFLTCEEVSQFSKLYSKMLHNREFLDIITQLETEIIKNSPLDVTALEIVVLRKVHK